MGVFSFDITLSVGNQIFETSFASLLSE